MKTTLLALSLTAVSCIAQVQTAWIRTYHNDLPGKTNQPVAVKLDTAGNIIVTGSSQNATGDSDYVVLKYAQDGTKLWEARYASPANGQDLVAACSLDPDNNVYVTGTSKTLKYSPTGTLLWEAAYAGADLCWDRTNIYLTGLTDLSYGTAKLDARNGTNIWTQTALFKGDSGEHVATDEHGNVYVAGFGTVTTFGGVPYYERTLIKYAPSGVQLWTNRASPAWSTGVRNAGLKVHRDKIYTVTDFKGWASMYTYVVSSAAQLLWRWDNNTTVWSGDMAVGSGGDAFVVGAEARLTVPGVLQCNRVKNGQVVWSKSYPPDDAYYAFGKAVALNSREDVIVAGHCNLPNKEDMVTLKYSNDGKQLWAGHYNGAANGNDRAVALAVAPDDSIYVAGYSATTQGGTEMVLIKYIEPRVNATPKTSGDVQIQMNGVPGSRYAFQSSGDLQTWLNLSTNTTDATGQATFTDTNAGNLYPFRFYRSLLLP